jgi:hypothetical protein
MRLLSVNGISGRLVGTPEWMSDPSGQWYLFDSKTNYIVLHEGAPGDINLPEKELTIEAWVNLRSLKACEIIGFVEDNGAYERGWWLGILSNKFNFSLVSQKYLVGLRSSDSPEPNRWYHVAATFDGSVMRIYVDGKLSGTYDQLGAINYQERGALAIGAYVDENEFYVLDGLAREIRIYNRVLTPGRNSRL